MDAFFLLVAVLGPLAALAVVLRLRKPALPEASPRDRIAPDEWHRVRRTMGSITRVAKWFAALQLFAGGGMLILGTIEWRMGGDLVFFALFGVIMLAVGTSLGGLTPTFLHECLATAREIRYYDVRGEVTFPREGSTATIVARRNRVRPFQLRLRDPDGRRRWLDIDPDGVATLRGLGWVEGAGDVA